MIIEWIFISYFYFFKREKEKMATSYSAGQYNQEFQPKRMQMHQVPAARLSQVMNELINRKKAIYFSLFKKTTGAKATNK